MVGMAAARMTEDTMAPPVTVDPAAPPLPGPINGCPGNAWLGAFTALTRLCWALATSVLM